MVRWFKNLMIRRSEEKQKRAQEWHIYLQNGFILMYPNRYRPIEQWDKWGKMQFRILMELKKHWPGVHSYIRLHIYTEQDYSNILNICENEIVYESKDTQTILFPDCDDQFIYETILSTVGLIPLSRCIYCLDDIPINWRDTISQLFDITQKLEKGHLTSEFENQLSICRCLCYSLDENLVIAKADLEENEILLLLENIAHEEYLSIIIHR
jgi:hypothetical protein